MAFSPENNVGNNLPENKPSISFADYVANYKKTQKNNENKKIGILATKGHFLENTDLAKIEIPDFGKQILDEIDDVKKSLWKEKAHMATETGLSILT